MKLVLASSSPRRRDLLEEHGYDFVVRPAEVEEDDPPFFTVAESTLHNARKKALAAAACQPRRAGEPWALLGVDTLVALDGERLGKPGDLAEAASMLRRLSGREHQVFSGLWVVYHSGNPGEPLRHCGELGLSHVRFRALDEEEITRYLARIAPLDKAGAYAAQDQSPERVVAEIDGSRSNVIGLPMELLAAILTDLRR